METRVYLVRHGVTDWHRERRVLGTRDVSLNDEGRAQARAVADALAPLRIGELVTSPMARAVETAEVIAKAQKLPLAKDPRLAEIRVGRWEGMSYDDVAAAPDYQKFVADPLSVGIPGGERLTEVRDRATGAIRHLLAEGPAGDHVAIVTHAAVVRIMLAHYLGMSLASYHLLKVAPGSVSVIAFKDDRAPPRILAVNVCGSLADVS